MFRKFYNNIDDELPEFSSTSSSSSCFYYYSTNFIPLHPPLFIYFPTTSLYYSGREMSMLMNFPMNTNIKWGRHYCCHRTNWPRRSCWAPTSIPSTPFSSRFAFTIRPWIFADKSRNLRSHLSCPISAETPPLASTEYQQQIARQFSKTIDKAVFTTLFNVIRPYFVSFFFFQ